MKSPLELFSVYYSRNEKRDDYIVFYIGHGADTQEIITSPEIAEKQWFSINDLPKGISPATRRRIQEYLNIIEVSEKW